MSSSLHVIHGWVDVDRLSTDDASGRDLRRLASALVTRGVRFVPLKLSADWAGFAPLSLDEATKFWGGRQAADPPYQDTEGSWFLADASPEPLRLKTLIKLAKTAGMRVALLGSRSRAEAGRDAAIDLELPPLPSSRAVADDWSAWAEHAVAQLNGWSSSAIATSSSVLRRPVLSIAVTTYNRASWLKHSLPLILEQTAPYAEIVEVVVCDNASQDDTTQVVEKLQQRYKFAYHRNEKNVGMLGNLGASCDCAHGQYVWVIGDDDLMVEGTLERVLSAIALHPEVELLYLNYAYTAFDHPEDLEDVDQVVRGAKAISGEIRDTFAERLSTVAANSENCFTAIYCLIYRADHARRAYHQDVSGSPFSSLLTSVPTADYVCHHLLDRPAFWIGDPCVVVNLNVSWLRYATLFILERFPELFDLMQEHGVTRERMDALRTKHLHHVPRWFKEIYTPAQRENVRFFSPERLIERFGHLSAFQACWPEIRSIYQTAFKEDRVHDRSLTPERFEASLRIRKARSDEAPRRERP